MTKEALKQALEALEDFADSIKYAHEQDDVGRRACCNVLSYDWHSENCNAIKAITALKEALAQPEQEPVACTACEGNPKLGNIPCSVCNATPPAAQRTWVGLKDDEIKAMDAGLTSNSSFYAGALWAEAKLKEKNT